jgi:hypothetical protein
MALSLDPMELLFSILAVAVFVLGLASAYRARRPHRDVTPYPRCRYCAYDLTGHADVLTRDSVCPECGHALAESDVVLPGSPHQAMAQARKARWELIMLSTITAICLVHLIRTTAIPGSTLPLSAVLAGISAAVGVLALAARWWHRMRE